MGELRLYFRYLRLNLLSGWQYKGWPMVFISVLISLITDPIAVLLLFARFGSIGEWAVERVMLVYGIALASFGLAELFSRGYDYFPAQIRLGVFDRILLRPRSTMVQVLGREFQVHRLSKVVAGLGLIAWSLTVQGVSLNLWKSLQLLFALLGGYLTYTGVFIICSAVAFWTVRVVEFSWVVTNGSYQVAKCPPALLPGWLRNLFIFFMPMLVFAFYPAAAVCDWGTSALFGWLALPVGLIFLTLSLWLWNIGVSHYASTGS